MARSKKSEELRIIRANLGVLRREFSDRFAADPNDEGARADLLLLGLRERLLDVVEYCDKSMRQLSLDSGLSDAQVSHVIGQGKSAKWDTIAAIVRTAKVDGHWLLTGEGTMLRRAASVPSAPPPPPTGPIVPKPSVRSPDALVASETNRRLKRR